MKTVIKKTLCYLLLFTMITTMAMGCTKTESVEPAPAPTTEPVTEATAEPVVDNRPEGFIWDIKPLDEPATLKIAYLTGALMHLPTFIAEQNGWWDYLNITIETIPFPHGPAQMEAISDWDCGITGLGGILSGTLAHDVITLCPATPDDGTNGFLVRKDHPIALAGNGNLADHPEVYGTADTWKGVEVFTALGTTNHYTLAKTLELFGLTLEDIKVTNMDVASSNAAFLAGQGEVAGIWGPNLYKEDKKDAVMVSLAKWVDTGLVTDYVASPKGYADNKEAIEKWLELNVLIGQWCAENIDAAAESLALMYEEEGITATLDECKLHINNNTFFTLDKIYQMSTESNANGMLVYLAQNYNPLAFYVQLGNYKAEDLDKLKNGQFLNELISNVYDRQK